MVTKVPWYLKEGSILRRGSFSELSGDENIDYIFANYGSIETSRSDSKQDRNVQIIKDEKEKHRNRLDLIQEDEDKSIGTVSWRLYWDYFRFGLFSSFAYFYSSLQLKVQLGKHNVCL